MATNRHSPATVASPESLSDAATRQMKELDLSKKPSSATSTKSNGNGVPEQRAVSRTINSSSNIKRIKSPTQPSPTNSNSGSSLPGLDKEVKGERVATNFHKITVGNTASPNVSKATSKIGSYNSGYKPSGGKVKIEHKKLEWNAKSKIGSLNNLGHVPGGGQVKITSPSPTTTPPTTSTTSRINSFANASHTPGGGRVKIFDDKDYLKRARSTTAGAVERGKSSENLTSTKEKGGSRGRSSSVAKQQ